MTTSDEHACRWRVTGRVQGVSFRWFTRERARELEIEGYVRNLADGSVEVVARGPEERLGRLRAHLREGPPAARVDDLREEPFTGPLETDGFEIRF